MNELKKIVRLKGFGHHVTLLRLLAECSADQLVVRPVRLGLVVFLMGGVQSDL